MAQIVLAWISGKIDSPIMGNSGIQHLKENVPPGLVSDDRKLKYLEELYILTPVWGSL
ncbi:hypothetical protein PM082_011034 [Marasmius tenuissimus]|nr:hypothetical protein PM082_011034 [Marasmius tenuissimus]